MKWSTVAAVLAFLAIPIRRRFGIFAIVCVLVVGLVGPARANEIWVAPTAQQDLGGLGVGSNVVWPVTAFGVVRLAWAIPADLQTFQSAKLALIPAASSATAALTFYLCAAQSSQVVTTNCTGPFTQGFTSTANQLLEIDMSAAIGAYLGAPGANYVSVLAYTTPTTTTDHIVGLRFTYAPPAPAGVPTLASNTFTGTQTAPAFVGSGAGLTNLPVPAGVATLDKNTFIGTQTAPAFVGNGAGLTNLPIPAGVATLGANSFSGNQVVTGEAKFVGNGSGLTNLPSSGRPAPPCLTTSTATSTVGTGR